MNPSWTSQRRFVPVHLASGTNASSFSSVEAPVATKASFASDSFAKTAAPVGIDPPPTQSLRALRSAVTNPADISLVESQRDDQPATWPILVFGIPLEHRQALVKHFQQFGQFAVSEDEQRGHNCLKLEFDSRAAADRALQENGKIGPGGFLLGCTAVEKQASPPSSECLPIDVRPTSQSLFDRPEKSEKPSVPLTSRLLSALTNAVFGADDI